MYVYIYIYIYTYTRTLCVLSNMFVLWLYVTYDSMTMCGVRLIHIVLVPSHQTPAAERAQADRGSLRPPARPERLLPAGHLGQKWNGQMSTLSK